MNLPSCPGGDSIPGAHRSTISPSVLLVVVCLLKAASTPAAEGLRNAQFTGEPALQDWELSVYGAQPQVQTDPLAPEGQAQSLKVSANELSDAALGQEVKLKGNCWYRLRGWIKTQNLAPETAAVFGTLQIQNPAGRGTIASGPNRGGDTDWTRTDICFRAPSDGRVRVCLFFAGFGKGTGTAWFSGLKLEELDPGRLPVRVLPPASSGEGISPLQYGQFVEYLCNLVPGMWVEKLYDGGFEGLSPYRFEYIRETDFKEKPWYPSGQVNRAAYSHDPTNKVSGKTSKRIEKEPGVRGRAGISQDGICVVRGAACQFACWLRSEGLQGPVRVRLHRGDKTYASVEITPGTNWARFSSRLIPAKRDTNATLTVDFDGPGTLWLDNASMMPEQTVGGWRPDVVEAVRALKPGVIRFGGSAVDEPTMGDFEWKNTTGDPDKRVPFRAWGGLQPVGPGLEEIVQFCHAVGAEPLICVRFKGRTPRDAADQVAYFNAPDTHPMGAWRARNGHAQPYRIKYWQVGNELSGPEYEQGVAAFCEAMKQADPSIKLLSSFPTPGVLKAAGAYLDFLAPHHYSHDLAWMEKDFESLARMLRENAPGRDIRVAVTEWNTTAGDAGPRRAMLWTLANALACSRYHNLLHRHCGLVKMANRSNLVNSFCSGIIQTDNHRLYKTPTYYAQQLYANLAGSRRLPLDSELAENAGVDLSATVSSDGRTVSLFAVNDALEPITRPLDISALGKPPSTITVRTLGDRDTAGEPDVTNTFERPDRVSVIQTRFRPGSAHFNYRFPPLSLTVLAWERR